MRFLSFTNTEFHQKLPVIWYSYNCNYNPIFSYNYNYNPIFMYFTLHSKQPIQLVHIILKYHKKLPIKMLLLHLISMKNCNNTLVMG